VISVNLDSQDTLLVTILPSLKFLHDEPTAAFFISMDKPQLVTHEEVMFFDTDIGGGIHNLAYLRMIETNRTKLAGLMGMDLKSMADENLFPVLLRTEADYKRPGTLGDTMRIEGELKEVEKVRFWCEFHIYRECDETLLVTCRQSLALVKMPQGKPQRLPKEWISQWGG